jgi:hypothetical protein
MSDNLACDHPGCGMGPFQTREIAHEHVYQYHSASIPLLIGGCQYDIDQSDGHYVCPFLQCQRIFNKLDDTKTHIIVYHDGTEFVEVLSTPEYREWHITFSNDTVGPTYAESSSNLNQGDVDVLHHIHLKDTSSLPKSDFICEHHLIYAVHIFTKF